jgi:phosphatidate phosphatase PAH1
MDKEKQIERNCNNCKRQHTKYCPNSSECISLPNLPYFETDVIRLLEHDWDMHEKKIYELEAENDRLEMKLKQCIDEHSSMCDMNVGLMHDMENMKAENERICQNSVSHETFKAIMDEKDKEIKALKQAKKEFDEPYLNLQIDRARLETLNDIKAIICCATEQEREDGCQYIGSNNFEDMWNELDEYEEKLEV